ncbi:hypothetical protein D3C85_1662820 [compost metagenome]
MHHGDIDQRNIGRVLWIQYAEVDMLIYRHNDVRFDALCNQGAQRRIDTDEQRSVRLIINLFQRGQMMCQGRPRGQHIGIPPSGRPKQLRHIGIFAQ